MKENDKLEPLHYFEDSDIAITKSFLEDPIQFLYEEKDFDTFTLFNNTGIWTDKRYPVYSRIEFLVERLPPFCEYFVNQREENKIICQPKKDFDSIGEHIISINLKSSNKYLIGRKYTITIIIEEDDVFRLRQSRS